MVVLFYYVDHGICQYTWYRSFGKFCFGVNVKRYTSEPFIVSVF